MPEAPLMQPGWDSEMKEMIQRFQKLGAAKTGFDLTESETIVDPALYHRSLETEIRLGPGTRRAQAGSVKRQLAQYLEARKKHGE